MSSHVENTEEFFLDAKDGTAIFVRDWPIENVDKTKPSIILMHGLGEHSGRYIHIARFFNALGFFVRTFDQRGHGQSAGPRGDVPDSEAILRDTQMVINDFAKHTGKPPLLFAHSMGGLFATHLVLAHLAPVSGIILASPALAVRLTSTQKFLFKLSQIFIPGLGIPHGTNGRFLSHDNEVVLAYQNDALVHSRISARLFESMLKSMRYVSEHANQLTIPLLLLVAQDDQVVDISGSEDFSNQLRLAQNKNFESGKIKTIYYPGFYHELFNELDALRVFDDVREWLVRQNYIA
jgi:alpha-beta hydrolase superfamily lysophospholipase